MYKRTLYVTEDVQQKIDLLSQEHKRSKAEILRLAVELGLQVIDEKYIKSAQASKIAETPPPPPPAAHTPSPTPVTPPSPEAHVVTSPVSPSSNQNDDFLTRVLRNLLK
ncbi:hypothetical protein HY407_00885 [Candidatus Gottesmanbacteria bacterium]|nr:hypothetical protein [Candidatus Gottesmanbacteria bacterium]